MTDDGTQVAAIFDSVIGDFDLMQFVPEHLIGTAGLALQQTQHGLD